jgi:hypothetical protein
MKSCTKRPLSILIFLFFAYASLGQSQSKAFIYGNIRNAQAQNLELVNISILGYPGGTSTNKSGNFELQVPAQKPITVIISFIGYYTQRVSINLSQGERYRMDKILLENATELEGIRIEDKQIRSSNLSRIDPKNAFSITTLGGGVEALVKTQPGVVSNNELSSQYSVRGGNYDENLIYVNDFEIYRPFLVRSGQQEGLSFLNPDLVSGILFSAGGFEAKYGDKMSSVLDIQYKKPSQFGGSASLSLLGATVHIEGISKSKKLNYLLGLRQKSNQYVLSSLQTKGDYRPSFTDIQANLNYKLSEKLELSALGNYSLNIYRLVPEDRETSFGTIQEAYKLKVYFDGQEKDRFENFMVGLSSTYKPYKELRLKFMASAFRTIESETYDINGEYWIGQLESDLTQSTFGQVIEAQGVGTYLNHARNKLDATVANVEHRGTLLLGDDNYVNWGLKFQHEWIEDRISEWEMVDSAGFSIPGNPDSVGYLDPLAQPDRPLLMKDYLKTSISLSSNRISGFFQRSWQFKADQRDIYLTAGLRSQYWDLNKQLVISPRATVSLNPKWEHDILFKLSGGFYYQPPFYRELRDLSGTINKDLKAQSSWQIVAGSDLNFKAWNRDFKFVSEIYFKYLYNLVPYVVDNVRIRYYADNNAHGYATGIDLKVNGEFVKGIESWASLSIMKTMEDIEGDFYWERYNQKGEVIYPGYTSDNVVVDSARFEPGYISRPTDQRVNFNLFFQDYLPSNPTYKMSVNVVVGTGFPFGAPKTPKYLHTRRIPPYRRVDIGFSKMLKGEDSEVKGFLRHFKSVWLTAEVFNLLQFSNTISYIWVTDVDNRRYAIPNYLTPRQINIKLMINF